MTRKTILAVCLSLLIGHPSEAKKKKQTTASAKPKTEQRTVVHKGLFDVQKQKDDWFLIIPDSMLGKPFLAVTRYVATPVGTGQYGGEEANEQVLYWEKKDNRIFLRALMYKASADSTDNIFKAVTNSTENPIVASVKLDSARTARPATVATNGKKGKKQKLKKSQKKQAQLAAANDSTPKKPRKKETRVKVSDLFKGDNPCLSIHSSAKTALGISALKPELSYIDTIKTFPMNTEIVTVKTFTAKNTSKNPSGQQTGLATFRLNTSFVMLPEQPMRYRTFDPRVGYFTENFQQYGDQQQETKRKYVVSRWRLEPKDSADLQLLRQGQAIEPKKPIVFYIDPATPQQWHKWLILGVNDWQQAFEAAGWKNAIRAEEWPADSTMSLEDARFSVIRYLASDISNAYGPHISDPRTGEIIESHIGWYHNVMQLIHDWYMVQAGAIDPRAQNIEYDEQLMGSLIRFVVSHEVGHTLGLRHNMGASNATPVEKLRDAEWLKEHGHTASIMDYARFNYVAQPEDNVTEEGIMPRVNDYDRWAIKWGYTYFPDAATEEEERLTLSRMTTEQLQQGRRYWFGGEGTGNDPRAQREDLGDDAMKASDYGVKNLKRIVPQLEKWAYKTGDNTDNLERFYHNIIHQMQRYIGHVRSQIGGVWHEYRSTDDQGEVNQPVPKAIQRRALQWIDKNVFTEPTWLLDVPYIHRLERLPIEQIRSLADAALTPLTSATVLHRLSRNTYAADSWKPEDYVSELTDCLFRETKTGATVTPWRRYLQQQAVARVIRARATLTSTEAYPIASLMLRKIQQRVQSARSNDALTRAHYQDLVQQIQQAFETKR